MSRITQKPAIGAFNPWINLASGTANQDYAAVPNTSAQPSTGTGNFQSGAGTYVGQKFDTADGRELVYVQNGTSAIGAGKFVQAPAEVTAHQKLAMTVPTSYPATAGTYQIYVTNGATVLNVNAFQGGFAIVASGTGAGQILRISSHQAAAASASFVVTTTDPIQTTLDATSKISLVHNPYGSTGSGVVVSPTTATGTPIGVTLYGVAASTAATYNGTTGALTTAGVAQYTLIVCHGPTSVLIDTTTTVGYPLGPSKSVAGAATVATLTTVPQCGISAQTQTDTQYGLIYLTL